VTRKNKRGEKEKKRKKKTGISSPISGKTIQRGNSQGKHNTEQKIGRKERKKKTKGEQQKKKKRKKKREKGKKKKKKRRPTRNKNKHFRGDTRSSGHNTKYKTIHRKHKSTITMSTSYNKA